MLIWGPLRAGQRRRHLPHCHSLEPRSHPLWWRVPPSSPEDVGCNVNMPHGVQKEGETALWAPELLPRWCPTKSWGALMNGKPQHDMTLREPSPRGVQARPWGRQGAVRGREHPEGPGGGLLLCAKRVLRLSAILSDTTDGQSRRSTPSGRADSSGGSTS